METLAKQIEYKRCCAETKWQIYLFVKPIIPWKPKKPLMLRCNGDISKGVFNISFDNYRPPGSLDNYF